MAGGFSSCGAWAQYLCLCVVAIMHVGPSFPQPEIRLQSLHRRSDSQPLDTREVPILLFLIFGKVYLFFFFVLISLPKGLSILLLLFFSKNQLLVLFSGFIFSHFVFNNFCPYLYYFFLLLILGFISSVVYNIQIIIPFFILVIFLALSLLYLILIQSLFPLIRFFLVFFPILLTLTWFLVLKIRFLTGRFLSLTELNIAFFNPVWQSLSFNEIV